MLINDIFGSLSNGQVAAYVSTHRNPGFGLGTGFNPSRQATFSRQAALPRSASVAGILSSNASAASIRVLPGGNQELAYQMVKRGLDLVGSFALLVALHELIEVALCEERGITCEQVDNFDKSFELHREPGNKDEPGDDPAAPYRKEHFFATNLERLLAAELGIDWAEYERKLNELP